jgi:hypothetical protein
MTTPEGMAVVIEAGLAADVFEEPIHGAVFAFSLDYWRKYAKAPSRRVLNDEYPGLNLPELPEGENQSDDLEDAGSGLSLSYEAGGLRDPGCA